MYRLGARSRLAQLLTSLPTVEALIAEQYRGIRPAAGYPAQPDHTEKEVLFRLLGVRLARPRAEKKGGVS